MTEAKIDDYARIILEQNKNIASVQLAPNGIVSIIYSLEGNENFLWGASEIFEKDAITKKIVLPDNEWEIAIYQEKLEAAKRDFLTGTLNKSAFETFTQKQLSKKGYKHGIILMDLNDFKQINDELGHPLGDAALIEIAK